MKKQLAVVMMLALGGLALAQPAGGSAKAPAPAGGSAKAPAPAGGSAAAKPAEPPKDMGPPKPAAEIAEMTKAMGGNWKCIGKAAMDPANPANMTDMKGTYKATADLDKFWIKGEWTATMGKVKSRGFLYTTYDAAAKKWFRHSMDTMGMGGMEWSTGLPAGTKEGKITWEGDSHGMGIMMKTRTTEEISAKSQTMTSEMSMDGGKKWVTAMTMTCTK
jgi:hypothetical protein